MDESKSIKILNICKVVPADSPSQFSLPLTFLDRLWLQVKPTPLIFFYETNTNFHHTILPKLKHSLSLTLSHYLPLAGNLTWPTDSDLPVIQYNTGDGISLTIAETQASFNYLSGDAFRETAELYSLVPDFPSSETLIPVMTMKITLFPGRGFSVAYVVHHAVMDGKSINLFAHLWAYICKKGEISILTPDLTPSFDRTFVQHQVELEKVFPKVVGSIDPNSKNLIKFDMTPPSTVLGTFKLTRDNIEALKNKAKTTTRVSTFAVTSAYVLICLIKAKKVSEDFTCVAFSADARLRLDPPLPLTYFGNCLAVCIGGCDTQQFLAEDGYVTALRVVSETVANLNDGIVKVVEKTNGYLSSCAGKSFVVFSVGGSPRFDFYKVDFGWAKPVKWEIISITGGGAFYLADDKDDNGGVEIGITLEKHEAKAFTFLFTNGLETC